MTTYLTSINNQAEAIEKTLIDLGYQLSDRGKYWQCNAIYRDGDNRTALQIWKDTGIWKDFVANTTYQPFKRLLELSCKDDSKIEHILHSIKNNNDPCIESIRTPKMESDQFFDHEEVKTLLPHYDFYNNITTLPNSSHPSYDQRINRAGQKGFQLSKGGIKQMNTLMTHLA